MHDVSTHDVSTHDARTHDAGRHDARTGDTAAADPCVWIGTSWKMNKTLAEARVFADGLLAAREPGNPAGRSVDALAGTPAGTLAGTLAGPSAAAMQGRRIQGFVLPPFTLVRELSQWLDGTGVLVGAQNMHWEDAGAWTGEISPAMLLDCGLDMVELGHSERRAWFGETDETVGRKTASACRHGLVPLICIGETLKEREAGRADEVLQRQVESALQFLSGSDRLKPILFAYEPVWAIGEHGIPATSDYADERQQRIKAVAADCLGAAVPCLYGGSVNAGNCVELISCNNIDGLFIGRSAWDVAGYLDILERCAASV